MNEFVARNSDSVKYQNSYNNRVKREKKLTRVIRQAEIEDTSIYEYDVECLKRRGISGHIGQGFSKE